VSRDFGYGDLGVSHGFEEWDFRKKTRGAWLMGPAATEFGDGKQDNKRQARGGVDEFF